MPVNADKPHLWKADVERSIDFYNDWFVKFAPETFRTQRQRTSREVLAALKRWLTRNGYQYVPVEKLDGFERLAPGQFTFRLNIPADDPTHSVTVPVDAAVQPIWARAGSLPLLIEAKSAGDATNTNKRRKEEAQKLAQLRRRHGEQVSFVLLLCGYFEPGYLGYEAAEGIDWVWEHRLADLAQALKRKGAGDSGASVALKEETAPTTANPAKEERRLALQREIDTARSANERNRAGQFATPLPLAVEVVAKASAFLPGDAPLRMLEPACGTGAFFSAASTVVAPRRWQSRVGVELDPVFAKAARELWTGEGVMIVEGSFTDFSASPENQSRFNLLCTNPPYVRHHHLGATLKQMLQARVARELGIKVSGLTGLYVYFVLLSHSLLEDGAVASWLIPSEFMSVNCGEALRRYLVTRVTLLDVFQFDPEEVQFDDALVSSCVVTYRKSRPPDGHEFDFRYGGSFVDPSLIRRIRVGSLSAPSKAVPFRTGTAFAWNVRSPLCSPL